MFEATKLWKRQAAQQTMNDGYQSPGNGPAGFLEGEDSWEQRTPTADPTDDFRPRLGGRVPIPTHHARAPPHLHSHPFNSGPSAFTARMGGCPWDQKPRRARRSRR